MEICPQEAAHTTPLSQALRETEGLFILHPNEAPSITEKHGNFS